MTENSGRFNAVRRCEEHGGPRVECLQLPHKKKDNPDLFLPNGKLRHPPKKEAKDA